MSEPVLVGLLFADRVITENTGKKCIIGTFTTFNSPNFPVTFPPWGLYAGVTNLIGKHNFTLNLVDDSSNQVLFSLSGEIDSHEASGVVEIIPTVSPTFAKAGIYTLTFHVDGELLGARNLSVTAVKHP